MIGAVLTKRVIQELTPTEQFIRAVERAKQVRSAALARLDADFVERIEDARNHYLATPVSEAAVPTAQESVVA
jgi:hypothetical protein